MLRSIITYQSEKITESEQIWDPRGMYTKLLNPKNKGEKNIAIYIK
jgi:hypothetical protein